jgi:8-oxo-dGTP diphosphatase
MGESGPEPRRSAQRVAVYGIYESPDREVLLVRAAPYLTVAGQWFLPGGGLEHGEDPVAGLRREFAEETGLDVRVGDLLGILSDLYTLPDGVELHTIRIIYAIRSHTGSLRHEVGGSSDIARWFPVEEARSLPLRPYVLRALTELR